MIVERTYDEELVRNMLFHFLDRISEDNAELEINVNKEAWILMSENDQNIGIYCLHPLNSVTLQIHAHVLPEFRRFAYQTGVEILTWFLDNVKYDKIVAEIPKLYPDVYYFTKKFGFQDEGINRQSHKKYGKLHDTWYLGITRSEVKEFLSGSLKYANVMVG